MMDKERRREDDGGRVLYLKVMTDEQVEVLRRQIAVYAAICEQLVEMHRAFAAQQDALAGMKIGGVYADSLMVPGAHKITARQRWTPTSMQLQILESIFEQGHGTPCKQNLLKITQELSQHGEISEANVYNWFQNRRARSKRKQTAAVHGNTGPEIEADDESSSDMKSKPDNGHPNDMCLANQSACDVQTNNKMHFGDTWLDHTRTYQFDESSKSSSDSAQMLCFGNASSDDGLHHLIADLDIPGSVCPFQTSGENGYMA